MATQAVRPYIDRLLGGTLDQRLTDWRAEGLTYRAIAKVLDTEFEIDVTPETVRAWCRSLEATEAAS